MLFHDINHIFDATRCFHCKEIGKCEAAFKEKSSIHLFNTPSSILSQFFNDTLPLKTAQ